MTKIHLRQLVFEHPTELPDGTPVEVVIRGTLRRFSEGEASVVTREAALEAVTPSDPPRYPDGMERKGDT